MPRSRPSRKLGEEHLVFIDEQMAQNDELTARHLRDILEDRWPDLHRVSLSTIKRARRQLGWVATRPKYCQLVRQANREKRVLWCRECLRKKDKFDNVIWIDECSVQLDSHTRLCFRRKKEPHKLKARPKHPAKLHIWGGISQRGATSIVIFSGIMTSMRYCSILERGLLPFIEDVFPDGHRFQMDNDPKHCSHYTRDFLKKKEVNWWRTPPESPDLNPIECVWGSLKYYLRYHYKPKNLDSLTDGIQVFWKSLTPAVCSKYIGHIQKVMPRVVEVDGHASGY